MELVLTKLGLLLLSGEEQMTEEEKIKTLKLNEDQLPEETKRIIRLSGETVADQRRCQFQIIENLEAIQTGQALAFMVHLEWDFQPIEIQLKLVDWGDAEGDLSILAYNAALREKIFD